MKFMNNHYGNSRIFYAPDNGGAGGSGNSDGAGPVMAMAAVPEAMREEMEEMVKTAERSRPLMIS